MYNLLYGSRNSLLHKLNSFVIDYSAWRTRTRNTAELTQCILDTNHVVAENM